MTATQNSPQNRFEIVQDGQTAIAVYELNGKILVVTHVVVPPSLRGQGIASDLARAIIQHARAHQLKIRPQCPFMAAFFERYPKDADLRV